MFKTPPVSFAATLLGEEGLTMPEICTKPKAPSPRELSPKVTEGVPARRRQLLAVYATVVIRTMP